MKLHVIPPQLSLFDAELELVICVREDVPPEIFWEDDKPRPDRHLLLGMMQTIVLAVEEADRTCVAFSDRCSVQLEKNGEIKELDSALTVVRAEDGRFGALAIGDQPSIRRLAKRAERWFTGTIRLDIP